MKPKVNDWSIANGLTDSLNVIYSGNIGFKHNPQLLLDLAMAMARQNPGNKLIVISEGVGAEWLKERQAELKLGNLLLFPFQPYDRVPEVMGSADVLLAFLEPDSSDYCVPSKVLSYSCAGRAIILSAKPENLASRIINESEAGLVSAAGNSEEFCKSVLTLLNDDVLRSQAGENARGYAETTFDIDSISEKFLKILHQVKEH